MNKTTIRAIADVIEYFDRFDMGLFVRDENWDTTLDELPPTKLWNDCGTAGCVGGWLAAWADVQTPVEDTDFTGLMASEFDIPRDASTALIAGRCPGLSFETTDSKQAAQALRDIADDKIVWQPYEVFRYGGWVKTS